MTQTSSDTAQQHREEALIVTAELAEEEQSHFNAMREFYFPPALNMLDAHLTLFHAIPGHKKAELYSLLERDRDHLPVPVTLPKLMNLGRGFAVAVKSAALLGLLAQWQRALSTCLTPQDRQKKTLHITVQNKVEPAQARRDLVHAQQSFTPHACLIVSFAVWRYEGGPWTLLKRFCGHASSSKT